MTEQLRRVIYHEKQEPDSNLCAQHALNNLLQQAIFTAPDLATIARRLDRIENSYVTETRKRSTNMDDSGFFSVQVLEDALQVWGLTLVRWRSEEMKPFQDKPYTQLAFILNLELHWFTLRRFGPAEPNVAEDQGVGHWFNLNSFLQEPEWVSKTYLGMVLQQAETEGYSVFAICQIDPLGHLALARTKADEVATTIPEITSASKHLSTSRKLASSSKERDAWGDAGVEDDDPELQAALLASVLGAEGSSQVPSSSGGRPSDTYRDDWDINHARSAFGSHGVTVSQPVVEETENSLERTQRDLAAFQASRRPAAENRLAEGSSATDLLSRGEARAGVSSTSAPRRPRGPREDEEEEEMMRRAIEASRQESQERDSRKAQDDDTDEEDVVYFDEDDQHMYDEGEEEREELERLLRERRRKRQEEEEQERYRQQFDSSAAAVPPAAAFDPFESGTFGSNAGHLERHYDDEDAELQAALKASLEGLGGDLTVPPPPKPPTRAPTRPESPPTTSKAAETKQKAPIVEEDDEDEDEDEDEESEEETEGEASPPKPLTAEELRKARLARFA